jgi:hypothetical protein
VGAHRNTVDAGPHWLTINDVTRLFVAARLATAQQQYVCAATLFGLAGQMHSQVHYAIAGPMRALADAALATAREALEPAVFTEAYSDVYDASAAALLGSKPRLARRMLAAFMRRSPSAITVLPKPLP